MSDKPEFEDAMDFEIAKRRIVVMHGEVDEGLAKMVTRQLLYLEGQNQDPIRIVLNSVGGDVYDGLLVFDTLRDIAQRNIPVTVEARGLAASMAAIVLQGASHGKRVASKYTRFLIHEISSISAGTTSQQEEQVAELRRLNDMLRTILAERTGRPAEEIEQKWRKTDVWMSADEAKEFGLVDEVV